ncbi:MAG: hypothetical protein KDA89_23240 [Planctomycetaceae bacterium]|nr:hypothetical protein [Planctomycetaceae bacterium]
MLKVIGLGYPRTGTMSLKHALEMLSLGPCYHMIEVFDRPEDPTFWLSALGEERPDWQRVFRRFQSTADAPACHFWRQLYRDFPNAAFILTVRDPESWYDSFRSTVYEAMMHPERAPDDQHREVQKMARTLILDTIFEGRFEDRAFAVRRFKEHNADVRRTIPPAQLLTFQVADGWEPLCRFLNTDIPTEPFPQVNSQAEFRERFAVEPGL